MVAPPIDRPKPGSRSLSFDLRWCQAYRRATFPAYATAREAAREALGQFPGLVATPEARNPYLTLDAEGYFRVDPDALMLDLAGLPLWLWAPRGVMA